MSGAMADISLGKEGKDPSLRDVKSLSIERWRAIFNLNYVNENGN